MKTIINVKKYMKRANAGWLHLTYRLTLECGHVDSRSAFWRMSPPNRLKCKVCE